MTDAEKQERALFACRNALLAAMQAGEEPEAAVDRLYAEHGGIMEKESMLAGAKYAQRAYEIRRQRQLEATNGLAMPARSVSVALNMADWRLYG